MLRMSEKTQNIDHIPEILYSWRMLPSSTAANADAKPYAQAAGQRAIQAHLDRILGKDVARVDESENLLFMMSDIHKKSGFSIDYYPDKGSCK